MKFWGHKDDAQERFNREILVHLDSAYNLARWLVKNGDDADDIVQEACIRAFRNMDQRGGHAKAWFLSITRNTAFTFLSRRPGFVSNAFDGEMETLEWHGPNPEQSLLSQEDKEMAVRFIEELPPEFREVVILRDVEDLSYKEIAEVTNVPVGTVMSRLNRARQRLQQRLADRTLEERKLGL